MESSWEAIGYWLLAIESTPKIGTQGAGSIEKLDDLVAIINIWAISRSWMSGRLRIY
jgi:hypothetical protein